MVKAMNGRKDPPYETIEMLNIHLFAVSILGMGGVGKKVDIQRCLMSKVDRVCLRHAFREANKAAHLFARERAKSSSFVMKKYANPPIFVEPQMHMDLYCIVRKGGNGKVYECQHKLDKSTYAIKLIPFKDARWERFMRWYFWPRVPKTYKEHVWNNTIKQKFVVNDDKDKDWILQNLGRKWSTNRCDLYHTHYDETLSLDANIEMPSDGISRDQWALFLNYGNKPETKEMCDQNHLNRQKQVYTDILGSMSLARKKDEEVQLDAHEGGVTSEDAYTNVFGKEHPGRVRSV